MDIDEIRDAVPLPLDADGEVIHIGDLMQRVGEDVVGKVNCIRITLDEHNHATCFVHCYERDSFKFFEARPRSLRHYHKPTVEELLMDLMEQVVGCSAAHTSIVISAVEKYAAKLRLRDAE